MKNHFHISDIIEIREVDIAGIACISKPHAHPHSMMKTPAKFQDDRYKTVRGAALTRHPE